MNDFRPTYLYIKTHNITKLKYFGKTTQDPFVYNGSGTYWKRHLKIHGNDVTTEILGLFVNREVCIRTALEFSKVNKIVESTDWANLKDENGLDGGFEYVNQNGLNGTEKARLLNLGKKRPEHSDYMKRKHEKIPSYAKFIYFTPLTPTGGRYLEVCRLYTEDMITMWVRNPHRIVSKQAITLLKKQLGDKVSYSWVGKSCKDLGFYRVDIN